METVKMRREKRPGNREVVIVEGFPRDADLEEIARELKRACGTGGTAKHGAIELQGDHRDKIVATLARRGYRAVRAGG
jgi:translation initiation factor 1